MILIADSGSTKTDWCFVEKGKEPIKVSSLGINPYYQASSNIAEELAKALLPVYNGPLKAIHYYGTGITGSAVAQQIHGIIANCYPFVEDINISSDLIGAARALYGSSEGITVILGTGANTGFFNGEGITEQIAPLGFWLGDEGSGGYIGKEFFKAYLRKDLGAEIVLKFQAEHGEFTRTQVLENAYHKPFPNRFFASFARFVIENKANTDCAKILNDGLEKLFVRYLLKYKSIHKAEVGFVGSIAYYLREELNEIAQKYQINLGQVIKSPIEHLVKHHLAD
jgi:N-acetylglucosamine kinase-like BadF-type ATPase